MLRCAILLTLLLSIPIQARRHAASSFRGIVTDPTIVAEDTNAEVQDETLQAVDKPFIVESIKGVICDRPSINEYIKAPENVGQVRRINWNNIDASASEGLIVIQRDILRLKDKIDKLGKDLEDARMREEIPGISNEEIKTMISAGVAVEWILDIEHARTTECGMEPTTEEIDNYSAPPDDVGLLAKQAFQKSAKAVVASKKIRVNHDDFFNACVGPELLDSSYGCIKFCRAFATIAATESVVDILGHVLTSDELTKQLEETKKELVTAAGKEATCIAQREYLKTFGSQMKHADEEASEFMDRTDGLYFSLRRGARNLKRQIAVVKRKQQELQEVTKVLNEASDELRAALLMLKEQEEKLAELEEALRKQEELVRLTAEKVNNMQEAITAMQQIKTSLSSALLSMVKYYDVVIRDPIDKLGIKLGLNIGDKFAEAETAHVENMRASLFEVRDWCIEGENQETLQGLPSVVVDHEGATLGLPAICKGYQGYVLDWDEVIGEVESVVALERNKLVSALTKVQSNQNIFKVSQQSQQQVAVKIAAGVPTGLREAHSIYGSETKFMEYMQGWTIKQGKLGKMLILDQQLGSAFEAASEQFQLAKEGKDELDKKMVDLQEIVKKKGQLLQKAKDLHGIASKKVVQVELELEKEDTEQHKIQGLIDKDNINWLASKEDFREVESAILERHREVASNLLQVASQDEARFRE